MSTPKKTQKLIKALVARNKEVWSDADALKYEINEVEADFYLLFAQAVSDLENANVHLQTAVLFLQKQARKHCP